jgi:hypothetical protein
MDPMTIAMIGQALMGMAQGQGGQGKGDALQLPPLAPFNPQPMQTGPDTDPMLAALRQPMMG